MSNKQFNSVDGYTVGNASAIISIADASGNLTANALTANGNVSFTGANVSLGNVSNLKITGGSNDYLLSTDGTGNLSWVSPSSQVAGAYVFTQSSPATTWVINHNLGYQYVNIQVIDSTGNSFTGRYNYPTITFNNTTHCTVTFDSAQAGYAAVTSGGGSQGPAGPIAGSNTQIIFNDAGSPNGSANLTFDKSSNIFTTYTANVNGLNATANVVAGNVYANSGTIGAQTLKGEAGNLSNIQGGNVSGAVATATSATTAGTVTTNAQPNITSVGSLTSLTVSGNANVGNLGAAQVLATSNITSPQLISNVSTGTSPLVVASTTLVSNLNADLLDGYNTATANTASTVAVRDANGNISANYFIGNGSQLTGIITSVSNVSNGNSNVDIPAANGNITVTVAGNANVVVFTGTGVNIAGTLNTTGNATVGNLTTGSGSGGNITGANVITANTFIGTLANGNSNVNIPAANGNINLTAVGNTSLVVTGTGANVAGTLNATGNANVNNLGTTRVIATGNISGTQLISNIATGTAPLVVTSTTQVANLNAATAGTVTTNAQPNITSVGTLTALDVTGNVNIDSNTLFVDSANNFVGIGTSTATIGAKLQVESNANSLAGFLLVKNANTGNASSTGIQVQAGNSSATTLQMFSNEARFTVSGNIPLNIVSNSNTAITVATTGNVGISNTDPAHTLSVTGTMNVSGNANIGNIGATNGVFTNVSGNGASLSSITGANVTGAVSYATTANSVAGANVSGQVANALVAGTVYTAAQPNITSVGTLTSLDVTGNVSANNLSTTNKITAGNGLQVTTGTLTVTNGNLDVTGNINVTGNLNYSNVTDLVVGDPLIYIGANNTGDLYDLGIVGSYNDGVYEHTGLARNATNDTWTFFDGVVAEPTTVIDWANATYPTVKLGNLVATGTANITGNANVGNIGATNGVFTNVSGNGSLLTALNASNISSGTLDQARLANSSLTVNGQSISLGGSGTITANTTQTLTLGSYLTGTSFNGGTAVTATVDATTTSTASKVVARDANANIYANNAIFTAVSGNGSGLSAIAGANVTGTVASATAATTAGTVTTAAQPNITSVGTLTSLAVTGNANVGNIGATNFVGSGASLTNLNASNISSGTVPTARLGSGTANANTYLAGDNTWKEINVSGASISNGNSNVNIPAANGNIQVSVAGNSNVITFTGTSAFRNVYELSGFVYQANTAPSSPRPGDQWYNTFNGILFQYVNDGTSSYWIDIGSLPAPTPTNYIYSVSGAVSAAGTVQGNATILTSDFNVVNTVSSGQGVKLPADTTGLRITIMNTSANSLNVYPAANSTINSLAANVAYSMNAGTRLDFLSVSATKWYTLNATYG